MLGAVVLVVTGAEALYADMGHFGKRPIRLAWFGVVLPALCSTTSARARCCSRDPSAVENPFFRAGAGVGAAARWSCWRRCATVIASQALISGAFSLTQQAIQLGYLPRMRDRCTPRRSETGQIYVPVVNWVLLVGGRRRRASASAARATLGRGLRHRGDGRRC